MKIEPIETERLRLRGFTPADAMFAIGIWNSPDTGWTKNSVLLPKPMVSTPEHSPGMSGNHLPT